MRYDGTMLITERFDECRAFYALLLDAEPTPGVGVSGSPTAVG
jgi:hypothetical protein